MRRSSASAPTRSRSCSAPRARSSRLRAVPARCRSSALGVAVALGPDRLDRAPHARGDVRDRHDHARCSSCSSSRSTCARSPAGRRAPRCRSHRSPVATYERPFYFAMLAVFAVGACSSAGTCARRSSGCSLFAIRDDEDRARGLGVAHRGRPSWSPSRQRRAHRDGRRASGPTTWASSIRSSRSTRWSRSAMVLMAFLGGKGTLWGPVLGALHPRAGAAVPGLPAGRERALPVGYSAVFLVVMLLLPRGIIPSLARPVGAHDAARGRPRRRRVGAKDERCDAVSGAARGRGPDQALRRGRGRRRLLVRGRRGHASPALIGPNGSGQDHRVQPDHRVPAGRRRQRARSPGARCGGPIPPRLCRRGLAARSSRPACSPSLTVIENMVARHRSSRGGRCCASASRTRRARRAPEAARASSG